MTAVSRAFACDAEWPIDDMPPMSLEKGLAMVGWAGQELSIRYGVIDEALDRQHIAAAYAANSKYETQQSTLKTEAAQRFWIFARGWAVLISAVGGGSVVTLLVEHVLLG